MSEKKSDPVDFSALFKDAKPIKHNNYAHNKPNAKAKDLQKSKLDAAKGRLNAHHNSASNNYAQQAASIALSDEFEAHFPANKPIKYIRKDIDSLLTEEQFLLRKDLLKKLSMAQIPPDIELDLHGARAKDAKLDIIQAIFVAKKRQWPCINIIHGHGNGILKKKIPNWLVQHPDVAGFVQAPRAYSGRAGLLVLINTDLRLLK